MSGGIKVHRQQCKARSLAIKAKVFENVGGLGRGQALIVRDLKAVLDVSVSFIMSSKARLIFGQAG